MQPAFGIAHMAPTSQVNRVHNLIVRLHNLEELVAARLSAADVDALLRASSNLVGGGWAAVLARAQELETRLLVHEARRGVYGIAGQELVEVVRRVGLLERGVVQLPDHQSRSKHVSGPRLRVVHALERYGIRGAHFLKVAVGGQAYYERMTLEERAKMLAAPSVNHLCKSLLMSVTGDTDVIIPPTSVTSTSAMSRGGGGGGGGGTDGEHEASNPPMFVMVVLQYNAKLDSTALRNVLRASKTFAKPGHAIHPCMASAAQAKTMLGFPMNGTAPIGGFVDIPILMSHEVMELDPPVAYLGGGDDDVKLYLTDVKEFVTKTGAMVGRITEPRYIGKEGALFRALSAESATPSVPPTPDTVATTPDVTAQGTPPPPVPQQPQQKSAAAAASSAPESKKKKRPQGDLEDASGGGAAGGERAITFNDLDVRVGHVVRCWKHPDSEKLICEEIDVGEGAPRAIASGLQKHYTPEAFQNQRVLVVCNLAPAKLGGFVSNGMVLCASWQHNGADVVKLVQPALSTAKVGERVVVLLPDGEVTSSSPVPDPLSSSQVKKKHIFPTVATDLMTSLDGVVQWRGVNLTTASTKSTIVVAVDEATPRPPHGAPVT